MISILDLITIIGFTWGVFSVGFSLGRAFEKFRHKESRPRPKQAASLALTRTHRLSTGTNFLSECYHRNSNNPMQIRPPAILPEVFHFQERR